MGNSSSILARFLDGGWRRVFLGGGVVLMLLGAGGYVARQERATSQVAIGGQSIDRQVFREPSSTPRDEEKRAEPAATPSRPGRPAQTVRPVRPVRPRPQPIVRPNPAASAPADPETPPPAPPPPPPAVDEKSAERPADLNRDAQNRPPAPVVIPVPTVTPTPRPRPTPRPSPESGGEILYYRVEPTPTPALFHQEEVEGDYPGRLEKGSAARVRIRLTRKMVERPTRTEEWQLDGDRTALTESIDPVPGRSLEVALEESQGRGYAAWVRCRLRSETLEITPIAPSDWRQLGRELNLDWEWSVRATSPALQQELLAEMEIEWRPLEQGRAPISHRLWQARLPVAVADPLLKSGQLRIVSPLLGGSGALLMLIAALPIGRRRRFASTAGAAAATKAIVLPPDRVELLQDLPVAPPATEAHAPEAAAGPAPRSLPAANLGKPPSRGEQEAEVVECSVFAPPIAPQGETIMIQVFAHCEGGEAEANRLAIQFDPTATSRGVKTLSSRITRGTELTFHLTLSRLTVAEPVQSLVWMGDTESVQFIVDLPADARLGNLAGKVTISQNSVPIGQISFLLRVVPAGTPVPESMAEASGEAHAYRYTFISYASEDRDKVLARVQMLDQMGIEYFQDVLSLDPGQRWEKELYRNIDRCDLFLLFWSTAARKSEWVLREVDYAIDRKGGYDDAPPEIKPVIIEGPPLVTPPERLKHLHFNDRLIYLMSRSEGK